MLNRIILAAGLALMLVLPEAARAQEPVDESVDGIEEASVYRREVFRYERAGRRDPFLSLLNSADLGIRIEDLALRGVVFHPESGRSIAVLEHVPNSKRHRLRVGESLGPVRVAAISPTSVDVLIEELGVSRRETLLLKPNSSSERSQP